MQGMGVSIDLDSTSRPCSATEGVHGGDGSHRQAGRRAEAALDRQSGRPEIRPPGTRGQPGIQAQRTRAVAGICRYWRWPA